MIDDDTDDLDTTESPYDVQELDRQAIRGNKAYGELHKHAGDDWTRWEATIIGLAALRDMTFAKLGHRNMRSQAYRDEISALMSKPKYASYSLMRRQERSACYKLMDRIHDISAWYATLPSSDKLAWTHPETMVKHVPDQFLATDPRDNLPPRPKPKNPKKPVVSAESERLRALLIQVIKLLMKYEPATAEELMDQVMPPGDPDDGLENI